MKIAFWSNASERCHVSANLAAISVASVIRYPYSIIVLENHLRSHNLGKAYCTQEQGEFYPEPGWNYYEGRGMEGLLRKIYRDDYNDKTLRYHLKEVISKHLYYIPQCRIIHNEIFEYEFNACVYPLFDMIHRYGDICLIDTASHDNLSTKTILDQADLIVVNLCQEESILEDFFYNYSSMLSKAIFLISNYESSQHKINYRIISNHYSIPMENIIPIPKNLSYEEAYSRGSVVEFISSNYTCIKDHPNFIFMQTIKRATHRMIKSGEEAMKEKEILMCQR